VLWGRRGRFAPRHKRPLSGRRRAPQRQGTVRMPLPGGRRGWRGSTRGLSSVGPLGGSSPASPRRPRSLACSIISASPRSPRRSPPCGAPWETPFDPSPAFPQQPSRYPPSTRPSAGNPRGAPLGLRRGSIRAARRDTSTAALKSPRCGRRLPRDPYPLSWPTPLPRALTAACPHPYTPHRPGAHWISILSAPQS
jgi:hypothetical protein